MARVKHRALAGSFCVLGVLELLVIGASQWVG